MNLTTVVQLEKNLWAINEMNKTTMYLINGASKALLIDTGLGITNLPKLIKKLCGEKQVIVVNTHAHEDHNSGNNQFSNIYVGRYDEVYAHRKMTEETRKLMRQLYFQEAIANGFEFEKWEPGPSEKVYSVKENELIELGDYTFRILEVPSHTLGSIVLWEEKTGWMFTGDIMLTWEVWGHLTDSILAPSASLKTYLNSLRKLLPYSEKITWVFPSHGVPDKVILEKYGQYKMPATIIEVYCKGIESVFQGSATVEKYHSLVEDGVVTYFPIGGIVFQKERMY